MGRARGRPRGGVLQSGNQEWRKGQGESLGSRKDAGHGLPGRDLRRSCSSGSRRLGAQLWGEHNLCSGCQNCMPQKRSSERCRHLPKGTQLGTGRLEFKPKAVGLQSPISHSPSQSVSWQGLRDQPHGGFQTPGLSFSICTVRRLMWLRASPA